MPYIQVADLSLPFGLRRSSRAKHMHIRLIQSGFEIVAPFKIKNHEIVAFAWRQRNWMFKILSQQNQPERQSLFAWPPTFLANETIPYRGRQLLLHIKYGSQESFRLVGNTLVVTLAWGMHANVDIDDYVKQRIFTWYRDQSSLLTQQAMSQFCPLVGKWPKAIKIKQQKTRWGSCSPTDVITINWLLVLAPNGVLEYVVLHEVCHLIHRNHSQRFWKRVEKAWPNYVEPKRWLKRHGASLQSLQE